MKKYLTVLISVAVLFSNSSIATATPNQKSTLQAFSNEQVVGDNEIAAYIGTGGLLLPSSFSGSDKASIANCQGCVWAYTIFCLYDEEGLCQHSVGTCPVGQIRYRVWFGKTQSSAQVIGSVCWGSGRPPTRLDIERGIDDLVINYIPDLQITLIPPGKTLTSIPVLGWTNQPSNFKPPKFQLAGRIVDNRNPKMAMGVG